MTNALCRAAQRVTRSTSRSASLGAILGAGLLVASATAAFAGSATLTLTRTNLTNVTDAAGLWQYEAGTVASASGPAGQYAIERRVTSGGTDAQNTAATRITLFFGTNLAGAPDTIVLEGSHSYNSGAFNGSVAATGQRYAWLRDGDASAPTAGGSYKLTISWTGSGQLKVP